MRKGTVYLVGAGPGEPGLITAKGLDYLKQADVVIYDYLVNDSLLENARPDSERIYVGKSSLHHAREQDEINQLLVQKAREGKAVIRLKGGDPFVLGRGGEEAEFLVENHIPFEIVPGVSSAIAVPAYAGIPVTHRQWASSFAVITGHRDATSERESIKWDRIANGADTLIFLMGVGNLGQIVRQLVENGRAKSTPVAIIRQGASASQQTLVGKLENIVALAEQRRFEPPAVIVVGEVVRLREQLRWFDSRPLFGKRILVTRAAHQAGELSRLLTEAGALPVEMPVIEIEAPESMKDLDDAILNLKSYHWIVFTSVNGVDIFFQRLSALNVDARWFNNTRIGVIGSATASSLRDRGLHPDYIPQTYTTQGFLAGFVKQGIAGCKVLLPRADIANKELTEGLIKLGAEVHEVIAYRTVAPKNIDSQGKQMLLSGEIDVTTFTSPSTVTNLVSILGGEWSAIKQTRVACIGPTTTAAAMEAGLKVDIMAKNHIIPGLVEAMEQYFEALGKEAA